MSSGTRRQSAPGGSVSPPQSPTTNPKSTTDHPIATVTTAAGVTQSHHQRLDDDSFMSSSVPIGRWTQTARGIPVDLGYHKRLVNPGLQVTIP